MVSKSFATDSRKLLIPGTSYKNANQKSFEIENFENSGLSYKEWRVKKCYRGVIFETFWNSKLCPADGPMCLHSYNVEELHMFKKYYDYLLQISELCADGYIIDVEDRAFLKNSTQDEVDRFIKHIKDTRKQEVDYNNLKQSDFKTKNTNKEIVQTKKEMKEHTVQFLYLKHQKLIKTI